MAISETKSSRAPRGSRPVTQAFMTALESVPETSRSAVAKAAMAMIRDELRVAKGNMKLAAAKDRANAATTRKKRKASVKVAAPEPAPAMKKRRGRRPASAPSEM
jgi:hypothetical protein